MTLTGEENQIIEYAHFYYALSHQKNENLAVAKEGFQRLLKKYPNWANQDEVYYALADISFQEQNIESGLDYLNKIQSTDFSRDSYHIKGYHLAKLDIPQLRLVQQNYPQDTMIAQILVDKIAAQSENFDEINFMNDLVTETQPGKA